MHQGLENSVHMAFRPERRCQTLLSLKMAQQIAAEEIQSRRIRNGLRVDMGPCLMLRAEMCLSWRKRPSDGHRTWLWLRSGAWFFIAPVPL